MKKDAPPTIELSLDTIQQARADLLTAETAVEHALHELERLPRAQKTSVSEVVALALGRLRAARSKLDEFVIDPDAPDESGS